MEYTKFYANHLEKILNLREIINALNLLLLKQYKSITNKRNKFINDQYHIFICTGSHIPSSFCRSMTSSQGVLPSTLRKDFESPHLTLLTSKPNVRVSAHFVRLNTFLGEEGKRKLALKVYLRSFGDILLDVAGRVAGGLWRRSIILRVKRALKAILPPDIKGVNLLYWYWLAE